MYVSEKALAVVLRMDVRGARLEAGAAGGEGAPGGQKLRSKGMKQWFSTFVFHCLPAKEKLRY